jgi:putative hydrolase of the HAD superfamily
MATIKGILFDAAGTLFHLTQTVGEHYAFVGREVGLPLDAAALDRAFVVAWKRMPLRPPTGLPRDDDDKDSWRALVNDVFEQVAPATNELDRDNFFEVAYEHFAEAGVWALFPETYDVLGELSSRQPLAVISNFDGRLRVVLEHLGISRFFSQFFISSEIGYDKPDPQIFLRAAELMKSRPDELLHVGDDPERDWLAARAAGLHVFELRRPQNSLRELLTIV